MEFTFELANSLYNSSNAFPVDFTSAWQWLGYFDKATAKKALLNPSFEFEQDQDYRILTEPTTTHVSGYQPINPNPEQSIWLTVDCLKTWGMMAGTTQGKQVRKYFLQCEKVALQALKELQEVRSSIRVVECLTTFKESLKEAFDLDPAHTSYYVGKVFDELKPHLTTENYKSGEYYEKLEAMDKMTLAANRMGLSFNKHLKLVNTLVDLQSKQILPIEPSRLSPLAFRLYTASNGRYAQGTWKIDIVFKNWAKQGGFTGKGGKPAFVDWIVNSPEFETNGSEFRFVNPPESAI